MSEPSLILLHGYPFDHTLWQSVVRQLHDRVQIPVLTPDLPGFGDNPVAPTEPSIDVMADAVAELFRLHNLERAIVAGMSMGGYVALALADRYRDRIAGLGLVSTQTGADEEQTKKSRLEMIEKIKRDGVRPAVEAILPRLFAETQPADPSWLEFPKKGADAAGAEGLCWALEAMASRPDRTGSLKSFSFPVSIIHGEKDRLIPIARAEQIASALPPGALTRISGAGHATPLERPDAVAEALYRLIKQACSGAAPLPRLSRDEPSRPGVIWGPTEHGL